MKIAMVVPGGVDRSGEHRVVPVLLALIARLSRQHEMQVFALSQEPRPATWKLAGAQVHNIGTRFPLPRAVGALLREHSRGRFDLVQAVWAGQSALAAALASRLMGVPFAVHPTGAEFVELRDIGYGSRLSPHWRLLDAWSLRRATAVTVSSQGMVEQAAALGFRAKRIPLGVDLDSWPALAPRPRAAGVLPCLIHVASLNRVKDQATLLHAMARLRATGHSFRLDLVGEDTLQGAMQDLAARLGLQDCVVFHGFMTQRQLRPLFERAHVHVVSSRHEAAPVVMLEAAIAGVPTVGTAVGHVAEWAPQGAVVVPAGDAPALGDALARVLDDESLRLELAHHAMNRAIAEDADFTARQFEALYQDLLAR